MDLSSEDVAAWLSASCAEQGVPVLITDPHVLAKVAALLGRPSAGSETAPSKRRSSSRTRSQAPHRADAVRVHGVTTGLSGSDDGVVEDR